MGTEEVQEDAPDIASDTNEREVPQVVDEAILDKTTGTTISYTVKPE